ncbi:D-alanyl-D-alanine carboxypeptidase family protein [Flexibacterium corallicola]|uniref:D-alanyl-D-alanine carboxypeptidase family protein n=1 Tax=Flexibacterium corallicola TaxID=3037259 RepID=UPI00286EEC84|nr:D-alanyl-D-alanine carboxypeptidase family protein [Pseudovibrio sp. M1P-2-3]
MWFRLFAFCVIALFCASKANAGPKLIMDLNTGEILSGERIDESWYPASLTKIMTAYLALSDIKSGKKNANGLVIFSKLAAEQPASKIGLPAGYGLPLESALRLLLTRSANDVAVAIGEHLSGDLPSFIERMNTTAAAMGLSSTHFMTPHGLPATNQVTTAREMALLSRKVLMEFPEYMYLFSIKELQYNGKTLRNTNPLLYTYTGAIGLKTGYTCSSGYNLIAAARRGKHAFLSVMLGGISKKERYKETVQMLDSAFDGTYAPYRAPISKKVSSLHPVSLRTQICGARGKSIIPMNVKAVPIPNGKPLLTNGEIFRFASLAQRRETHLRQLIQGYSQMELYNSQNMTEYKSDHRRF